MMAPRIVVIGLGATGSAALHHLARRGVHAIGVEQFDIGHDRGSSHGPTRIFRLAHFENPSYVALMRRAHVLWRELETSTNLKLLHTTGIVEIGPAQSGLVRGTITASRDHNLRYETMDAATLMRHYPIYRMPDDFIAVWQQDGGFIEAEAAIAAQLRLSTDAGAQVRTNEKVLAV
ncbi:MAG TPA: FAD-dependent oxidoreductase, partial [Xanthobacteraceae bacterium]|nr:FAD-dependent oxidoreductase [Xanthobacteraceae bacterium]